MAFFDLLLARRPAPTARGGGPGAAAPRPDLEHPSADPGIAAAAVGDMLAAEEEWLGRLKLCYGCDADTFDRDIVLPIQAYAGYVNLLPATADNFFCRAGGLFRLGLEVAFYALQGTDAHIVSGRTTISVRKELEPRWRQATFLAGLCSELHRTLSHVAVTDEHGNEWPAYLAPLSEWLRERSARRFFVRWIANASESRGLGLFALPHIVPTRTMQHLAEGNQTIVPQMLASITGMPLLHAHSILIDLVRRSAASVINRDLVAGAHRYGRPSLGAHIERYLLDAMRRLIAAHPAWSPNSERSRVWVGADGLFVVWPNAAAEIRKLLEDDRLPGIPKAPETIVEILTAAGVLQAPPAGKANWLIQPPGSGAPIEAVRLSDPDILLANQSNAIQPLEQALVVAAAAAAAPARPVPSTSAQPATRASASSEHGAARGAPAAAAPPASGPQAAPAPAPAPEPQAAGHFVLQPPLRLVPQVRDALAAAIDTLNGPPGVAKAFTVPTGVFVPLEHFRAARIDVDVAMRALDGNRMLVGTQGDRTRTWQHLIDGQEQPGVIVAPAWVSGLDPADFRAAD